MSDFNAFDSTQFNSFRDSGFNARGRSVPFTIRFWFKFGTTSDCVFAFGPGWSVQVNGGNITLTSGGKSAHPLVVFSTSDWNHFIGGFDGDRLFAQLNNSARAFSLPLNSAPFGPGINLSVDWFFLGSGADPIPRLDEVALWKNRALSEADAAADYAAGVGLDFAAVDRAALLAYWELEGMDGADAGTLTDSLNAYSLARVDTGTPSTAKYGAGKFGAGLFNDGLSAGFFNGTKFRSTDPVFSFGDA
jgi:hypothetical protein